jgi:hypothetical protein
MNELIERYKPLIRGLVKKLSLPLYVRRDELFSFGLEAAWRSVKSYDPDRPSPKTGRPVLFKSYVYVAVWNDLRRMAGVLSRPGLTCASQLDFGDDESDAHICPETVPARVEVEPPAGVRERVAKLPTVLRTVVELVAGLDGEPPGWFEIAERVGLTVPQAKRAYQTALARL